MKVGTTISQNVETRWRKPSTAPSEKRKVGFHPIFGSRVRDSLILLSGYSKSESLPAK